MINYTQKTIMRTAIVFIFSIFAALFAYLFRLLLAKNLNLQDFGLFFSVMAFGGILFFLKDLGLSNAAIYFIPRLLAKNKRFELKYFVSKLIFIEFFLTTLILSLFLIFSNFLAQTYFHYTNSEIIALFSLLLFFNFLELIFQILSQAFQNQLLYSIQNLSRNLIVFFLTLVAFTYFSGIYVPVIAYILSCLLLLFVFGALFFKKTFSDFFRLKIKKMKFRNVILFGLLASFTTLGYSIMSSIDTLILTYFRTLEEVGLYNAATPIISLILYLPIAISIVTIPLSSELWEHKKKKVLKNSIELLTKYSFILLVPMAGALLMYPELILNILFGAKFIPAANALMILSVGAIFYGIAYIQLGFILGIDGPKKNLLVYGLSIGVNILMNLILVPTYGVVGAAIATSISYFFIFILSNIFINKIIKLNFNFIKFFVVLICGSIFVFVVNYLKNLLHFPLIVKIFFVVGIAGIMYVLSLFLFRIISFKELNEMKSQLLTKYK